jgi:hypothetical protein
MVRHLVLDDLDPLDMGRVHELAQRGEVSEVLLDAVEVDGSVAVVVGDRLVVVGLLLVQAIRIVVPGVEPEGGDAEVVQIGQARDQSLEIAAVVVARAGTVEETPGRRRVVVRGITVGEAIGHDQVHHVVGGEALEPTRARQGSEHVERRLRLAGRGLDGQAPTAGPRQRIDADVHEEIAPRRVDARRSHGEPAPGGRRDRGPGQAAAADHQPHRVHRMPGPPGRRLDLLNRGADGLGDAHGACREKQGPEERALQARTPARHTPHGLFAFIRAAA